MAYQELIKNFNRTRAYMRDFYLYGFKSREQFQQKSLRSYDDERRRIESWLCDFMKFRQTMEGRQQFLSIDSRQVQHNPLYRGWKAKSFTDGDITLHFLLLDILYKPEEAYSLNDIMEKLDQRLRIFEQPRYFDSSTVRKKLNSYVAEGVFVTEKQGKTMYYRRTHGGITLEQLWLDFFSEVAPCGVIGSYLLEHTTYQESRFLFKHHYITGAMDSEILCQLLDAIGQKRTVLLDLYREQKDNRQQLELVPLQIFVSVQNGRQYLMGYQDSYRRMRSVRLDHILSVEPGEVYVAYQKRWRLLQRMRSYIWGVSTQNRSGQSVEEITFTICHNRDEDYILQRLEREKRCGIVEHLDNSTSRFSAKVYDAGELIPWIRTFLGRIVAFQCSNKQVEQQFFQDLNSLYISYHLEEVEK